MQRNGSKSTGDQYLLSSTGEEKMIQAPEELDSSGPQPRQTAIHVCREKVDELELWLQMTQNSLLTANMQDTVEQQLLTCQEMLVDIEQKVVFLSPLGQTTDQYQEHDRSGLDGFGAHEEAELLSSKLKFLKASLVSFQNFLQERHEDEKITSRNETQQEQPTTGGACHHKTKVKRSCSLQEIFSSPRNKLLRQSSLQQQKELEQQLNEQRGLTEDICRQSSRSRLHSQETQQFLPADVDVQKKEEEKDSAPKMWDFLHSRQVALEKNLLLSPAEVTDSSLRRADEAVGHLIGTQIVKELQTLVVHLRKLSLMTAELHLQTSMVDESRQALDEGLFNVLFGVSLSLSSIISLLQMPAVITHQENTQLQILSAELTMLGSELNALGPKVSCVLGSECSRQCVDDLCRILSVVQDRLTVRKTQLTNVLEELAKKQRHLKELHVAFTCNKLTIQQITDDFSGTLSEQMQGELDAVVHGVNACCVELRSSMEQQHHLERLVHSLEELLIVGSERLTEQPDAEFHSRTQFENQLSAHMKFFQFLGSHFNILQFLMSRLPESAVQRWEGAVTVFQAEVERLQQLALEKGTNMQITAEMWLQWEEDSIWSDALLKDMETSFPKMQKGSDFGKEISENVSVYQELDDVLERSKAPFSQMLEEGQELQNMGCRGVGVATHDLEARWRSLHRRVELHRINNDRNRKLKKRFYHDSVRLIAWMSGARQLIDRWSRVMVLSSETRGLDQMREDYDQFVDFTKDLEVNSKLKAALVAVDNQLRDANNNSRYSEDQASSPSQRSDQEMCPVHIQLRQIELDWFTLLDRVPVIQQALHKRWLETLTQQGALVELQTLLEAIQTRSRLIQTSPTNADLKGLLSCSKECQAEMSAHQATLDYVMQPLQYCCAEDDHWGRYENIQFAEEQGHLNEQWRSLQQSLNSQLEELEQEVRSRAEQEAQVQQLKSWITDQKRWIHCAQTPSSLMELQRSISTCQDLEEKIRLKSAVLQDFRDIHSSRETNRSCELIAQADCSIRACAALKYQTEAVKRRLTQIQELWVCVLKRLNEARLKTELMSQTLQYYSIPQLSLQAQRDLHQRLQFLHEEAGNLEAHWDELNQTIAALQVIISPCVAAFLSHQLDRQKARWIGEVAALNQQLQRSQSLLQVWEVYCCLAASLSERLQSMQEAITSELRTASSHGSILPEVICNIQTLQERSNSLQNDLQEVLEAFKELTGHLEPSAASLIQSETQLLSCDVLQISQKLSRTLVHLQEELQRLQEYESIVESLERNLELWEEHLEHAAAERHTSQSDVLELSTLSADLAVANDLSCSLNLCDAAVHRLQCLNQKWTHVSTKAEEVCSALQSEALREQSFEQKCESWMSFLQRMEDSLAVDMAGSYTCLWQQLRTHKLFQAEFTMGHQILHSVITDALHLLHKGEVDDRNNFLLKLTKLKEHWQGAVQRADQRRSLVEGLVKHWHHYSCSLMRLQRFLAEARSILHPAGPVCCSLRQLRCRLKDLQHTDLLFQRYQSTFLHTLELGQQLFSMGDQQTQTRLQMDLRTLQEEWNNLHGQLGTRLDLIEAVVKNWERYDAHLADSMLQLKDIKTTLNQSMPVIIDELQNAEELNKENEDSLEHWAESLTELSTMKTHLSQYIITEDVLLLQEQVEHLHCQWEELCFKVSLRKQEIADRLNAWIIFNEKNKELCDWLTHMENKVVHNSDLNIEEMVEKLQKECMEEINLFSENKTHLKQLGEQLITASNKTKEMEINDKLKDINDRWQHLFDHIETRVRKLKETLVTVQHLDKNMSNLRTWLSCVEAELAKPVVYSVCHSDEIQRKLAEQQDLQRDIEQHTESVASVLTLCDVLLHDADACCSDSENDSIEQTTRSLDRRWRNICAMSMERRMRIEETWRLWCKFLDDYSHFEDWLKTAEVTAANPESANVLYTSAKEELKKFEAFQRQIHERLTQLELVNKQYRRLARENRTDAASKLKVMVNEGNQRWDTLQKRVACVLRRLKHFTSQREDFEGTREGILVWLTEMDLQLTNVEHFSGSDIEDKMRQLNGFQQDITLNTNKIDTLIVFGENLIQKSAPLDAVLIEDELEELHTYCQEVFGRVARFHYRLVSRRPVFEEERDLSDRDTDVADSPNPFHGSCWREIRTEEDEDVEVPVVDAVLYRQQAMCHLLVPPLERSGRETPVSVDSIPLEWDHTVDVGGSSHDEDEDVTFFSALSVKSVRDPPSWHQPGSPERKRAPRQAMPSLDSPKHATSTPFHQQDYSKLMSECSGSIDSVKRVKLILNDEEELDHLGLTGTTAEKHTSTGVVERWELLRAQTLSDTGLSPNLDQWQKLNVDLCDVTSWLARVLPELERLQQITPSTSIRDMEINIRKLKEMQRAFSSYKCLMISVNLSSRRFLHSDGAELRELQEALKSANQSWTQACGSLESWQGNLQGALMQCQEFNEMLHTLLFWLAQAESKLHTIKLSPSGAAVLERRDTLMALREELRGRQQQVSSLQEISSQLLLEADGEDSMEAKEKVHVIGNKLQLLLRQVTSDLHALQGELEEPALNQKQGTRRDSSARLPFLCRVLRAAFPLHLLFLVLLVLVCLVPVSEDNYSCMLSNNFARSFYPMLHYTNGPPPT